ncbi:MAG: terminase family protein [Gammaproteobacteria bacterium]|nr:terminase family protein [Gammaproteobacteria bacterium]
MAIEATENPTRREAALLYFQGYGTTEIARELGESKSTVASWKRRDQWDDVSPIDRVKASIDARLALLVNKNNKTERDLNEIDCLMRALERAARVRKYDETGKESDLNPKLANKKKNRKKQKNFLDEDQVAALVEAFETSLFGYQRQWRGAGTNNRIRNILKSRQIGATWYFAREALVDACETGRNQIFLSASKAQAHVFKLYILAFVYEVTGVELSGDPIVLWNGATLYFLGTNARTAQSYHGNIYMDEYFWIPRFSEFRKVASGMAVHKKWRQTYLSTPSALTHEAYSFWTGDRLNKGRSKDNKIKIDVSHKALKAGRLCEDGQWKQIVNINDAIAGGCDLFDLDELRLDYTDDEFRNLFLCEFIDDSMSIFTLAHLEKCLVDSWVVWRDIRPLAERPYGNKRVWIGYDPSRTRDAAAVAVLAPPVSAGAKFRIIERLKFQNMRFDLQAEEIKKLTQKYNVEKMSIDTNSIGLGVFDLVRLFFPTAIGLNYSPEVKTRLVLKAQSIIEGGRLEFDAEYKDVAGAFMSIRKTITKSGNAITYESVRSDEFGHGDLAWATMHALDLEPLTAIDAGGAASQCSIVEIF